MFETIVIDDFIDIEMQKDIYNQMIKCPWTFLNDVSGVLNNQFPSYGFVHIFKHPDHGVLSPLYDKVAVPLHDAMGKYVPDTNIHYTRSFFQVPLASQFTKDHNGIHVDLPIPHIACVYYVNGSDGDTIIYEQNINDTPGNSTNVKLVEHKRVTPKRGRLVMFDGSRYHCSSQPTVNYRCIINFDLV